MLHIYGGWRGLKRNEEKKLVVVLHNENVMWLIIFFFFFFWILLIIIYSYNMIGCFEAQIEGSCEEGVQVVECLC